MHTTPDEFKRLHEPGKYHIARFFWETDKIPQVFAEGLNTVDEIWTGSNANLEAIRNGGVTKPIKIIPQAIEEQREWPDKYQIDDLSTDCYLFYSIFEWTDRKNPEGLIRAFYDEFHDGENVALLIKTYFHNFTLNNKRMIRTAIENIKNSMPDSTKLPPIYVYLDLMDRQQIMRFHMTGDCFVSAHRGEGWGVPQVEAMLAGKPIISTGYGGVHEYLANGENAAIIDYKMVPVNGMSHSTRFYTPDQKWADPNIENLRSKMRYMFANRDGAYEIGVMGQAFVQQTFNLKVVGEIMAERLREIESTL